MSQAEGGDPVLGPGWPRGAHPCPQTMGEESFLPKSGGEGMELGAQTQTGQVPESQTREYCQPWGA